MCLLSVFVFFFNLQLLLLLKLKGQIQQTLGKILFLIGYFAIEDFKSESTFVFKTAVLDSFNLKYIINNKSIYNVFKECWTLGNYTNPWCNVYEFQNGFNITDQYGFVSSLEVGCSIMNSLSIICKETTMV